jgi:hypothetical protein
MSKIFFNRNGMLVDDSKFMHANGDQYPIRNITSVKVREKDEKWKLIIGLLLVGVSIYYATDPVSLDFQYNILAATSGAFFILWWWFSRKYIIWLGTGGMDRPGVVLRKTRENLDLIRDISTAINESISNLQKT